jgi:hypothetical protein
MSHCLLPHMVLFTFSFNIQFQTKEPLNMAIFSVNIKLCGKFHILVNCLFSFSSINILLLLKYRTNIKAYRIDKNYFEMSFF